MHVLNDADLRLLVCLSVCLSVLLLLLCDYAHNFVVRFRYFTI